MSTKEKMENSILNIEDAAKRVADAHAFLHVEQLREQVLGLEREMLEPDFWNNAAHAQDVSRRVNSMKSTIEKYERAKSLLEDARAAAELAAEEAAQESGAAQTSGNLGESDTTVENPFLAEQRASLKQLSELLEELEISSWFNGEFDDSSALVSINPGAGGLEAQDWTEMLFKMLTRYCEGRGWKVTPNDVVPGEGIGLDHATFTVDGSLAYGMLRSECGVHRLVRISPTDEKGRRHTTFAAVDVLPVLPDTVEVDINQNDLRIDVYRSSGPGGQCVNTTDSAVRITHIPTNTVVTCQNEKSQIQNRETAMKILKSRLYEIEKQKKQDEINEIRGDKKHIDFGSQIRNYVLYPYQLVKDVRSGVETSNVDAVLGGDLDAFVIGYHKWRVSQGV